MKEREVAIRRIRENEKEEGDDGALEW